MSCLGVNLGEGIACKANNRRQEKVVPRCPQAEFVTANLFISDPFLGGDTEQGTRI